MSWQDEAMCRMGVDDPREWDEAGTNHAHHVCAQICRVKPECLAAAMAERPSGQMRANVIFDDPAKRYKKRMLRWTTWKAMHDAGMTYEAIARETGYHETTVLKAVHRIGRLV